MNEALIKIEKNTKFNGMLETFTACYKDNKIDTFYNSLKSHLITSNLFCGKGGSHIWIKESNNINDRIAIITFRK